MKQFKRVQIKYKGIQIKYKLNTGEYKLNTTEYKINTREYKSHTGEYKLNTREYTIYAGYFLTDHHEFYWAPTHRGSERVDDLFVTLIISRYHILYRMGPIKFRFTKIMT